MKKLTFSKELGRTLLVPLVMPVTSGIPGLLGALVTTITLGLLTEIDKNICKKIAIGKLSKSGYTLDKSQKEDSV